MNPLIKLLIGAGVAGGIGALGKHLSDEAKKDEQRRREERESASEREKVERYEKYEREYRERAAERERKEREQSEREQSERELENSEFLSDLCDINPDFLIMEINGLELPINNKLPSTRQKNAISFEIIDNGSFDLEQIKKSFEKPNKSTINIKKENEIISFYEGYSKISGMIKKTYYPRNVYDRYATSIYDSEQDDLYDFFRHICDQLINKYGYEDDEYISNLCYEKYGDWLSAIGIGNTDKSVNMIIVTFYREWRIHRDV